MGGPVRLPWDAWVKDLLADGDGSDGDDGVDAPGAPAPRAAPVNEHTCKLTVYTDDAQLTSSFLREIAQRAFEKREEVERKDWADAEREGRSPHFFGNPNRERRLGGPFVQDRVPAVLPLGDRPDRVASTHIAFLAIFSYTCGDSPAARIEWYRRADEAWEPDAQSFWSALMVGDEERRLGGACWKALLDTPTRMGTSVTRRAPPLRPNQWKITGHVEWATGETCQQEAFVRYDVEEAGGGVTGLLSVEPPSARPP
jgi:hypothetical protein